MAFNNINDPAKETHTQNVFHQPAINKNEMQKQKT